MLPAISWPLQIIGHCYNKSAIIICHFNLQAVSVEIVLFLRSNLSSQYCKELQKLCIVKENAKTCVSDQIKKMQFVEGPSPQKPRSILYQRMSGHHGQFVSNTPCVSS